MTAPRPITWIVWSACTIAHVSSSSPMPSRDGEPATIASSRPMRPRCSKCWSITSPWRMPRPAESCAMRFLGVEPDRPNATMCEAMALAPADVPASTAPRSCARNERVAEARPGHHRGQPRLVPAGEVDARWRPAAPRPTTGSSASSRSSGRSPVTVPMPSSRNSSRYISVASSPSEEAVEMTTTCPSGPPGELREPRQDRLVAELVLGAADHHHRPGGAESGDGRQRALRPASHAVSLVVAPARSVSRRRSWPTSASRRGRVRAQHEMVVRLLDVDDPVERRVRRRTSPRRVRRRRRRPPVRPRGRSGRRLGRARPGSARRG